MLGNGVTAVSQLGSRPKLSLPAVHVPSALTLVLFPIRFSVSTPLFLEKRRCKCLAIGMCTLTRSHSAVLRMALALLTVSTLNSFADANSWLKPSSGNWEEPYWSQGILPNYGHAVMITNAGWKAVQIAPSTVQYYPDSVTVYSITVASPVD